MSECEYETMPGFCGVTMYACDPDCMPVMSDKTCETCARKTSYYCDVTTWAVEDGDECSVPLEFGGDSWIAKTCEAAASVSGIISSSYVRLRNAKLPLVEVAYVGSMGKHECPLCGGELVPMGWFRCGGLHELLHKCERCGLAVFR